MSIRLAERIHRIKPSATLAVTARAAQLRAEGKGAGAPEVEELRDYGVGAQILAELGVHDMVLLTNTHHTLIGLDGYGLSIVGERSIPGTGGE